VAFVLGAVDGRPIAAQLTGNLDLGASWVDYEGFLGSGSVHLSPTVHLDVPHVSVGASGTVVIFETGNSIVQGLAAVSWRTPALGFLRGELSAAAGANKYEGSPTFSHALARARGHLVRGQSGGWLGLAAGQSSFNATSGTPVQLELGLWTVQHGVTLGGLATRTWFEDATYADIVGSARWADASFDLRGSVGLRTWSAAGSDALYGELRAEIPFWGRIAALVSGGRYPPDPVRGVIAANYASVGIRIRTHRSGKQPAIAALRAMITDSTPSRRSTFELGAWDGGAYTVRVRAVAGSVELAADFTDWNPLPLSHTAPDLWEIRLPIPAGVHRLNVRLDGGQWTAPGGLRAATDEFGEEVGILIVPDR
jgi:hypothetical protein